MAIFFRGMTPEETAALTDAMLHSGTMLAWNDNDPIRVDKHSTGGIGDKVSLSSPRCSPADGVWVPMISGRGLGITGGTLDKLESIPRLPHPAQRGQEIHAVIRPSRLRHHRPDQAASALPTKSSTPCAMSPAPWPSIPLITASIMSKKLAEGLNRLVLDVKYGSGAFMKTEEQAHELAQSMVRVGNALGVRSSVRLSAMNEPTGESAGNALEVAECVRCLKGEGPQDLEDIVLDLASAVAVSPRVDLQKILHRGDAWRKFQQMVALQGGSVEALEKITSVHRAPFIGEFKSPASGVLHRMDAGGIGHVVLELGAGRSKAADPVDFAVGCDQIAKTGTQVRAGDVLLRVHARTKAALARALDVLPKHINVV
jgi:thymidine phosphorylase